MYNHVRRCLTVSITTQRKFLTQSIRDAVAAPAIALCASTCLSWHDLTRFCCQIAVNNTASTQIKKEDHQQKLNAFLSNPEKEKLFQILELEVDVMRHNAEKVPDVISPQEWLELLQLQTISQRKRRLLFLWRNEKKTMNEKAKKEQKRLEWLAKKEQESTSEATDEMKYGLSENTLFLRIYPRTMNHFYNNKLMQAMMFEPKIVFDCGYEDDMSKFENVNCVKQLILAFASNRIHISPMCLYFCNLKENGSLLRDFHRRMPNLLDDDFPAVITSQSYLDLFPKERLVYLTPHCKTDMVEYDPDMVYIIGAMVDKINPKPLSLAKAKKEGLRMMKLPLEMHLEWGSGSTKNLTLNQVVDILLDFKLTKDWDKALQHVPTRKLRPAREYMLMKKIQRMAKRSYIEETENGEMSTSMSTSSFTFTTNEKK